MTAISFKSQANETKETNDQIEDENSFDKRVNCEWDRKGADEKVSGCNKEIETQREL